MKNPTSLKEWLNQHGGRTEYDIISDEIGQYILVRDGENRCWRPLVIPNFNE